MKRNYAILLLIIGCIYSYIPWVWASEQINKNQQSTSAPTYNPSVSPKAKGSRLLGIDINEASNKNYDQAFQMAKAVGMDMLHLSFNWNMIETGPGRYDDMWPTIANQYYPPQKVKLNLILRPVDTTGPTLPSDLKERKLDDPEVIRRFKKLLDFIFSKMSEVDIYSLTIGNEVDIAFGNNQTLWKEYLRFFTATSQYAKQKLPHLKVGVTASLYGLMGPQKNNLQKLNEKSDVVMITYYPLNPDFTVKEPDVIPREISQVLQFYPNRQIHFIELGYPSSPLLNSSLQKQQEAIKQAFIAWDQHQNTIEYLSFTWLHDQSQESAKEIGNYYRLTQEKFLAYLYCSPLTESGV